MSVWMCGGLATHSRVTKHFVAGATYSAHVPWPNIRFMPLAIFHHFSVNPCADLDYYTTVDMFSYYFLHTGLYVQVSIIMIFRPLVTYVDRLLAIDPFSSRLHIENFVVHSLFWFFLPRDLKIALLQLRNFLRMLLEQIAKFNYRYQRRKSVSQLSTGNPCFHPPDPRAAVFSFQKQTLRKYSLRRALTSLPTDSLLHPGWKTFLSLYPGVDSSSFRGNQGPISTARYVAASSRNGVATTSCIFDS